MLQFDFKLSVSTLLEKSHFEIAGILSLLFVSSDFVLLNLIFTCNSYFSIFNGSLLNLSNYKSINSNDLQTTILV
jgi:hypothetical protein